VPQKIVSKKPALFHTNFFDPFYNRFVGWLELTDDSQTVKALMIYRSYCAIPLCKDHLIQTSFYCLLGTYVQGAPNERYLRSSQESSRMWQDNPIEYQDTFFEQPGTSLRQSEIPFGSRTHTPKNPWAAEVSVEYHNRSYSHPTYGPRLKLCTLPKHDYIERPGVTAMGPSEIRVCKPFQQVMFQFSHCSTTHLTTNTRTEFSGWNWEIARRSPIYVLYDTNAN
jgi:hypothetical protein